MAKRIRKLRDHPALQWVVVGKTIECIQVGPPDDVILTFEDGSRLSISSASRHVEFIPHQPRSGAATESFGPPIAT